MGVSMVHFSSMTTAEVQIFHKERWFERMRAAKVSEEIGTQQATVLAGRNRVTLHHGEGPYSSVVLSHGENGENIAVIHHGESVVFDAGEHIIKVNHEGVIKKLG